MHLQAESAHPPVMRTKGIRRRPVESAGPVL